MIEKSQARMYSEVYEILNILGDDYINKIPKKLFYLIKNARLKEYSPRYNLSLPLEEQDISKKTATLICMLHYNYWCNSEEEKEKIDKILNENEKKLYASYNYEDIFRKKEKNNVLIQNKNKEEKNNSLIQSSSSNDNNSNDKNNYANSVDNPKDLVIVKKYGIFSKIFRFIKGIFSR